MANVLVKKMYEAICYIMTYLMLLSIALTTTRFVLDRIPFEIQVNKDLLSAIQLFAWGIIIFLFVRKNYNPPKWINRHRG